MRSFISFLFLCFTVFVNASCKVDVKAQEINHIPSYHIVFLGIDGCASYLFEKANMPFVKEIMKESSWTLSKRSVLPSGSACNWASMFMGVGPEGHGFVDWDTAAPVFMQIETTSDGCFPNIFSLIRKDSRETNFVYYYQWYTMRNLVNTNDFSWVRGFTDSDLMAESAKQYIRENIPSVAIFVWDHPDAEGHEFGWGSEEYMKELNHLDRLISDIISVYKEKNIYDKTFFILTSDHGGHDKVHGTYDIRDLETPLILWGKGIKKNNEIKTPVMQYDVAAIIADYLHLEHPASWRGVCPVGIFE